MQSDSTASCAKAKAKGNDTSSSRGRKTGALSRLTGMPADILFEIFGHTHPYDILRLARVTKALRFLLLHRSASGVWRTARENLVPSMPDKPLDMSEPAWIHLAFDPQCHFCWAKGVRVVEWRFRVRICGKCSKIHIATSKPPAKDSTESLIHDMIPRRSSKKGNSTYLIRDYQAVAAKYSAITSPEDSKTFVAERKELIKYICTHAEQCEAWAQDKASDRTQELEGIRKERQAAIVAKLIGLGYEAADIHIEDFKYREDFTRTKPLTERGWKIIQGPFEDVVKKSRQERLARLEFSERAKPIVRLFQQYKNSRLPNNEIDLVMPGPIDLFNFPKIKALLSDTKIDETAIIPVFDHFVRAWQRYTALRLLYHTRRVENKDLRMEFLVGYDEEDKSNAFDFKAFQPFYEAVPDLMKKVIFVCDNCTPPDRTSIGTDPPYFDREVAEPLYYPEVLEHHCLTRNLSHRPRTECADTLRHLENFDRDRERWKCRIISVEKSLGRIFEAIVKFAQRDPASTSARDMDQLDMWFSCMNPTCVALCQWVSAADYWTYATNWRLAVKHHAEYHPRAEVDFATMTSFEVDFCRSRLVPLSEMVVLPKNFLCAHCRDLPSEQPPMSIDGVKDHLKEKHDISDAKLDQDYYKRRLGTPLRPVYGKGPLGESLEIFGNIPRVRIRMTTL